MSIEATAPTGDAAAALRPRLHFTPRHNWMNDPNGLVFHDGTYHLYFQYNPEGTSHDNISWGHASSPDLIDWVEHPVTIKFDQGGQIYSGSIVLDQENTSGFGSKGTPPLVAAYTYSTYDKQHQSQALAYSLDDGLTWTKYSGNPVLDRGTSDFRDPKVFRYDGDAGSYWVMVCVEAVDRQVLLYRSDDLKTWSLLSTYGPAGAVGGVWECPDLFPLAVDGDAGDLRWVLVISIGPAGGSLWGTQVVIGRFDGVVFTPDAAPPERRPDPASGAWPIESRRELVGVDWLDWGRDCYAGVTFSGLPEGEQLLIAWMSNWDYARVMPEAPWQGAMSLPRRLSLASVDGRPRLRQEPVVPVGDELAVYDDLVVEGESALDVALPEAAHIELSVRLGDADGFALRLRHDDSGSPGVVLRYDAVEQRLLLDRTHAVHGLEGIDQFPSIESAPLVPRDGVVTLDLYLDVGSIEVFADDGLTVITDLVSTPPGATGCSVASDGAPVVVERLAIADLGG